jgi:hypothetical protein
MGEMWSSFDIYPATPATVNLSNLTVATNGPAASFRVGMIGSSPSGSQNQSPARDRRIKVELNNSSIIDTVLNQFEARVNVNPSVPVSLISSNAAAIKIYNSSIPSNVNPNDRVVCAFVVFCMISLIIKDMKEPVQMVF